MVFMMITPIPFVINVISVALLAQGAIVNQIVHHVVRYIVEICLILNAFAMVKILNYKYNFNI